MWTDEKVTELHRLASETDMSLSEMADELGVTRNTVVGKLNRTPDILQAYRDRRPARPNKDRIGRPYKTKRDLKVLPGIHLRDLKRSACRWPLWDGRDDPAFMQYCGAKQDGCGDYCAEHRAAAYQKKVR